MIQNTLLVMCMEEQADVHTAKPTDNQSEARGLFNLLKNSSGHSVCMQMFTTIQSNTSKGILVFIT